MTPMLGIMASQISGHLLPIGFDSIQTVNGNGSASVLSFTSIPGTYSHLQIRGICRDGRAVAVDTGYITLNSTTTATYASHYLGGNGATATAYAISAQQPVGTFPFLIPGTSAGANMFGAVVLDFLDYANTNKAKTLRALAGTEQNGSGNIWLTSYLQTTPHATTQIDLTTGTQSAWATGTTFALYGIK